jgi:hypothetical protein
MNPLKIIAGLFILFWMAIIDIFFVCWALFGDTYPAVILLIGIWLGYEYSDWLNHMWKKLNRKLDEWADV